MIDSYYRSPYQKYFLQPLINRGLFAKLSPQMATLLSLIAGALTPLFLFAQYSLLAFICLIMSGFFDTLDGSLARHTDASSPKGAILDITCDRIVEFAVILGLYLYAPESRALACLGMLGSAFLCITTFLVVAIFEQNTADKSFHYSPGIMERAETFLFFALMILLPSFFSLLSILFIFLVTITAFIRIKNYFNN